MERCHDDFKGGFLGEFRVWFGRNAAAVISDGQAAIGVQADINAAGVTGNGFIHRVIENFSRHVMQGTIIGAADIHTGAAADRLKPFQHLDFGSGIITRRSCIEQISH